MSFDFKFRLLYRCYKFGNKCNAYAYIVLDE